MRWGEPRQFTDNDDDHVPDADSWLCGRGLTVDANSQEPDGDGDGLEDFTELMESNGTAIGHGERLHPALKLCDPVEEDTDRDGVPDGLDALPTIPMSKSITQHQGVGARSESLALLAPRELGLAMSISYQERREGDEPQPGALKLELWWGCAAMPAEEYELKVMLDLDNDGWFTGTDNYKLLLTVEGVREAVRHDASSHVEWPQEDRESVSASDVRVSEAPPRPRFDCNLALSIPCERFPELAAKPGEEIGLNVGIRKAGCRWFYMICEPNTLTPLELR